MKTKIEPQPPPTPEHEKLREIRDKSQCIGEFLEWLDDRGVQLFMYGEGDELLRVSDSFTDLLAEFFDIDLDKLEAEKRALLDYQRALNDYTDRKEATK